MPGPDALVSAEAYTRIGRVIIPLLLAPNGFNGEGPAVKTEGDKGKGINTAMPASTDDLGENGGSLPS